MTPDRWEQIKEIFAEAFELPTGERAAVLAAACGDDLGLRTEVDRLLCEHDQADEFLESPAHQILADPPEFPSGELIAGRFRIIRFLGGGGMGNVYEAFDEHLNERIAIKMLRPEIAIDPANYDRLVREVSLSRRISHWNVCNIFDLARHPGPGGLTFMTMELLEGQTLAGRLRTRGPITLAEALPMFIQLADGLASAHRAGVIHRDLKSANIFLAQAGRGIIRPVLMDFGVARAAEGAGSADNSITRTGAVLGTVAYMAPEQLAGAVATKASDVYSFGVVMIEALTGQRALAANQQLPPEISSVIVRCLQPSPDARFADGGDLHAALLGCERFQTGEQTAQIGKLSQQPGLTKRLAVYFALTLLFLALVFIGFRRYWHGGRIEGGASILLTEVENQTGEAELAGTTEVLRNELSQSAYFNLLDRKRIDQTLTEMSKVPETALTPALARDVAWRAGARATLFGSLNRVGGDYLLTMRIELTGAEPGSPAGRPTKQFESTSKKELLSSLQSAANWIRSTVGEAPQDILSRNRPPAETTTGSWEALEFYRQAENLKASGRETDALHVLNQALELDYNFVLARMRKSDILVHLGRLHEGFREYHNAIETLKIRRVTLREELRTKGIYALDREDYPAAVEEFKKYRAQFPLDYLPHFYLARPLMMMGKMEEAIETLRQASRINPDVRFMPYHLAMYNIATDRLELARSYIGRLRELKQDPLAESLTVSIDFLRGNYAAAERRAQDLAKGPNGGQSSSSLLLLACVLSEQGKYAQAVEALKRGIEDDAKAGRDQNRSQKLLALSYIRLRQNNRTEARRAALEGAQLEAGVESLLRAGGLLARAGFPSDASGLLAKIDPDDDAPKFNTARRRLRGEILLALGNRRAAVDEFERASAAEGAAVRREPLARALAAAGRKYAAAPHLERIAAHPGDIWQEPTQELPGFWADALFEYGKQSGSRFHLQQYMQLRAQADSGLSDVTECKELLRQLK